MQRNQNENHWQPSDLHDERVDRDPDPPGLQGTRRGCLVTFFCNGDPHFKGLRTSVSRKQFATFDTLTTWLSEKLAMQTGAVRYVFALPECRPVFDLGQFVTGRSYVASSVPRIEHVTYGDSREKFWHNKPASASMTLNRTFLHDSSDPTDVMRSKKQRKKNHKVPYSYPTSRISSLDGKAETLRFLRYGLAQPRMLVIRSNTRRASQLKFLFNPRTMQVYEDLLRDTTNALDIDYPPVVSLYTAKPPFRKVTGISHLMKGLRSHYEFLACGRELVPLELNPTQHLSLPFPPPPVEPRKPLAPKLPLKPRDSDWFDIAEPLQAGDRLDHSATLYYRRPGGDPWTQHRMPPIDYARNGYEEDHQPRIIHSQEISPPVEPEVSGPLPVRHLVRYDPARDQSTLPYKRKTVLSNESVKVHIKGILKEFFVPRYISGDGELSKPDRRLQLEWVYGYQGRDAGNNLHVLPSGELVYYVAGTGVVFDRKSHRQRHYLGHSNDISCIALHPDRRHPFVATGQNSGRTTDTKPQIRVWDPYSMNTLTILDLDDLQANVTSVQFSNKSAGTLEDGHYLLALDNSEQHVLRLWDWRNHVFIAKTATSSSRVVGASFHPRDPSTIVTFGQYHIYFWKFSTSDDRLKKQGRILRDKQSGIFQTDFPIPKVVTSLTFGLNDDVIAGTSNGDVIVWSQNEASAYVINTVCSRNMQHAHQRPVLSVCMLSGGTLLSGGGSEIKSWDSRNNYTLTQTKIIPERAGQIRTIVPRNLDTRDTVLYLGTTTNNILQETLNDSKYSYCIQGQGDELCAIAAHPIDPSLFVAAGSDCSVSQWHSRRHRNQWRVQVEKPCLSATYDPSGRLIVVGTRAGRFIVLASGSGDYVTSVQSGSEPLEGLAFSPDGRFLAVGSHDRMIYIFSILDQGRSYQRHRSGLLEGHSGPVTNVDWSKDSKSLQSVSSEPDLKFWDVIEMREKSASSMRDADWHTQTCSIGYEVLGAWSNLKAGQEISSLTRSNASNLLAVGHNSGLLSLYRFPCTAERPDSDRHRIGIGRITDVRFSCDDEHLICASGRDGVMIQWQLTTTNSLSNQGTATHAYGNS